MEDTESIDGLCSSAMSSGRLPGRATTWPRWIVDLVLEHTLEIDNTTSAPPGVHSGVSRKQRAKKMTQSSTPDWLTRTRFAEQAALVAPWPSPSALTNH